MKNKSVFSFLLWIFTVALGVIYFLTEDETREVEAIFESSTYTEKVSQKLLEHIEAEIEYLITISGRSARDVSMLDRINQNQYFLDSLSENNGLKWSALLTTLDTAQTNQLNSIERVLSYDNHSSEKIKLVHQNLLYQTYQYTLREYRNRVGDFYQMFYRDISLINLNSTIALYEWNNKIISQISVSPDLNQYKSYYQSFNFKKRDTVFFQVITEFYNNQREKEIKRYRIVARDKKGIKINSFFDYEEIK